MQQEPVLNFRWEYFTSHWSSKLDFCFDKQHFVDLSLVCKDGTVLKCHKMVLASCSTFFQRLLVKNEHPHPMIILHDIEAEDLKQIINFMYTGEIDILKNEVKRVLKIAKVLEVSGLKDINPSFQFPAKNKTIALVNKNTPASSTSTISSSSNLKPCIKTDSPTPIPEPVELPRRRIKEVQPVTRSKYNLRQRNVNKENDKKPEVNSVRKSMKILSSLKSPADAVTNSDENPSPVKRPAVDSCKYLKKLKLLNEVEIINKPYMADSNSVPNPITSGLKPGEDVRNCGIYIKDEIDISSDDDEYSSKLAECRKMIRKRTLPNIELIKSTKSLDSKASTSVNRSRKHLTSVL